MKRCGLSYGCRKVGLKSFSLVANVVGKHVKAISYDFNKENAYVPEVLETLQPNKIGSEDDDNEL